MSINFVCPDCRGALSPSGEGWRCDACNAFYARSQGVCRFLSGPVGCDQQQVAHTYSYIWGNVSTLKGSEHRLHHRRTSYEIWFGLADATDWDRAFAGKTVLDAGAGCGMAAHFLLAHAATLYAVDISAGIEAAASHWANQPKYVPVQADLLKMPFDDSVFDAVFTVGVLHHTADTRAALESCLRVLRPGGRIFFYIYKKKSPVREFADDYVREGVTDLHPDAAWAALEPFSALGEALSRVTERVVITEAIPALGIKRGSYTIHDLVHWHLLGCFWSPAYSRTENNRVNMDWYYPCYSRRHSPEEVWRWMAEFGLDVQRFRTTDNGIAVIASKPAR